MFNFNPVFEWILSILRHLVHFLQSSFLEIGSDGKKSIKHRKVK